MKRRRNHFKFNEEGDDLNGFLVDSDSESYKSSESFSSHHIVKKRKLTETDKKIIVVRDNIKNRDITFEKIAKLDLPEEDMIWFVEHIDILNHLLVNLI